MHRSKIVENLSGKEKAAILMITLGTRLSGQIFKHLSEDDIEQLTLEIASVRQVQPAQQDMVINECLTMLQAQEYVAQGGMDYAQEILEKGLGAEAAQQILSRLTAALQVRPFDFARKTDPSQLLSFIQHEHPQTIALILAYLHTDQASMILGALAPDMQVEVAKRLATLDQTTPEVVEDVEGTLERKLSAFATDFTPAGGIEVAVEVLNRVDRTTEKTILKRLEEDDPELAEEIRKRMFVFENIVLLADRELQRVIREVDPKDWPYALKAASEEVCEAIYRNMSKRQAEMIKEDIEFLGPVRLRDVEDAQQRVVGVIRRLEDSGDIIISRGGEDDLIV